MKRPAIFSLLLVVAAAHASPIAGKIALGTWNTQAEFADLKVVKGVQRLYQSNFWSGTPGWTMSGGAWSTSNGVLRQTGGNTPALAVVGDASWTDYTVTVRARKTGGAEGFLIGFGMPDNSTKSWLNLGGWNDTLHALEVPGVATPSIGGTIQTGRWYSVKVEVRGSDVRCYLDGAKVFDTMRLLDGSELNARRSQLLNSAGLMRLPAWEQDQVRDLLNREVFLGDATRASFAALPSASTFASLTPEEQSVLVRKVNRNRMTWRKGWGWGAEAWRDNEIQASMDAAVVHYNASGVYDKDLVANVSPGTPTADANWDGQIRFGGSRNYRVALHEISHTLGTGTTWQWGNLMVNGDWNGTYANLQLSEFEGAGSLMHGDGAHYWPYGLNYDNEWSPENERRAALIITGFRRDMGLSGVRDSMYATDVADGTYRLTPRLALGSALEAPNGNGGTTIDIRGYSGSANQKFRLERQTDGSYIVRTTLPSARCVDLAYGDASNGQTIQLWDDNGNDAQRWYLIPMGDGFYKIAPKNNVWKSLDLWGVSAADGTPVKLWDFYDGFGQQFRLDRLDLPKTPRPAPKVKGQG